MYINVVKERRFPKSLLQEETGTEWCEPVGDEEYNILP